MNSRSPNGEPALKAYRIRVERKDLERYLAIREVEGLSRTWLYDIRYFLTSYLDSVGWTVDEDSSLDYFKRLKDRYSTTAYRKHLYQIRRFLTYLGVEWARDIKPPAEPYNTPKRITIDDIRATLSYFERCKYFVKIRALILLGATSGMRAHELYQLKMSDIDLDRRVVYINHDPKNGQSVKTGKSRISFFTMEAKEALEAYVSTLNDGDRLFPERQIQYLFENAPIHVKDLRKFFSQEWDRRGGPTSVKKILMGHSLKDDVDLMHYNYQSEDDLKRIYDRFMEHEIKVSY